MEKVQTGVLFFPNAGPSITHTHNVESFFGNLSAKHFQKILFPFAPLLITPKEKSLSFFFSPPKTVFFVHPSKRDCSPLNNRNPPTPFNSPLMETKGPLCGLNFSICPVFRGVINSFFLYFFYSTAPRTAGTPKLFLLGTFIFRIFSRYFKIYLWKQNFFLIKKQTSVPSFFCAKKRLFNITPHKPLSKNHTQTEGRGTHVATTLKQIVSQGPPSWLLQKEQNFLKSKGFFPLSRTKVQSLPGPFVTFESL